MLLFRGLKSLEPIAVAFESEIVCRCFYSRHTTFQKVISWTVSQLFRQETTTHRSEVRVRLAGNIKVNVFLLVFRFVAGKVYEEGTPNKSYLVIIMWLGKMKLKVTFIAETVYVLTYCSILGRVSDQPVEGNSIAAVSAFLWYINFDWRW